MSLATNLRNAARTVINTFGNSGSLYSFSGVTKSTDDEGQDTVSSWGSATSIKVVDGQNVEEELLITDQGRESVGTDEKIIRDDVTIAVNDRLTINSVEFRVNSIRPLRTQDVLVAQIVSLNREDDTSTW